MKKLWGKILIGLVILLVGIQFIPANQANPPITHQVQWANAQTETYFQGACADCHSNETVWPWYSKVAPLSWWIAHHVNHGREYFNVSEPNIGHADEAYEAVHEGWMPLGSYTWMHPKAQLTTEQRDEFASGLKATFNAPESGESEEATESD